MVSSRVASSRTWARKSWQRVLLEGGEQLGLGGSQAVVEGGQQVGAAGGGDDLSGPPVGGIRTPLDQAGGLEIVEEVGHDRAVDAEVMGEGQLAAHPAVGRSGEDLVAAGTAGQIGHRGVGGADIGPEDHTEPPTQILRQGVRAARAGGFVWMAGGLAHATHLRRSSPETCDLTDTMWTR